MSDLHCAIVLPFLNEEERLIATCESLGFPGRGNSQGGTVLFLVDNGSTDRSPMLAQDLQRDSTTKAVECVLEEERGHVRARASGNRAVEQWAQNAGIDAEDVLVLQADADTRYLDGYVDAMRSAAARGPINALFEAIVGYPETFVDEHRRYFDACVALDSAMQHRFAAEEMDCVVDDKVAAYRLSCYREWGRHRREFDLEGDEILSETARLLIAGRARNARRLRVDAARAEHSARRLMTEPHMNTATAGYPRGGSWRARWTAIHGNEHRLDDFDNAGWRPAWSERRRHLLALLAVLPIHVARSIGAVSVGSAGTEFSRLVFDRMTPLRLDEVYAAPGRAIVDALAFVETLDDEFLFGNG